MATKINLSQIQDATANGVLLGSGPSGAGSSYKELSGIVPFGVTFDGGVSSPGTPTTRMIEVPFNCTIVSWTITADTIGSAAVEVWFKSGSAPPTAPPIPTSSDKISASAPVNISSAQSASGGSALISSWTKNLTQWGQLAFSLTSVTTCKWITVQLQCIRS